ncbi:MAG: competence protein ComJ [Limisphaerales bacterium]
MNTIFALRFYFSYNQFIVYDESVQFPGCDWTDMHVAQGFARRESLVSFGTPLEFGYANANIYRGAYQPDKEYERVIEVPFLVTSGKVIVCGPEELNAQRKRFDLTMGNYRLVAAQCVKGEEEVIDLFFEPQVKPLERSSVLVADDALNPPTLLVEMAEIAGTDGNQQHGVCHP